MWKVEQSGVSSKVVDPRPGVGPPLSQTSGGFGDATAPPTQARHTVPCDGITRQRTVRINRSQSSRAFGRIQLLRYVQGETGSLCTQCKSDCTPS